MRSVFLGRKSIAFCIAVLLTVGAQAEQNPEQLLQLGYRAYHEGRWLEVVQYLGEAAFFFPNNDLLYLYLGTAYQILGEEHSVEQTLSQGVNLHGENMQKIAFVLGNYYYSAGLYDKAADAYNLATWGEQQLVQAFLNRANLYLSHGFYSNALNDYSYFLFRKPFDPQREEIEAIIEKLMELGAEGRIQKDGGVISQSYPGGCHGPQLNAFANSRKKLGAPANDRNRETNEGVLGQRSAEGGNVSDGRVAESSSNPAEAKSTVGPSLGEDPGNALAGTYRRPAGDSGNTVGTGGNPEAQLEQLNRVRRSLRRLNQSAVILHRERPDIIEQVEEISGIGE